MHRKLENKVNLSGWATKDFSIQEFKDYLNQHPQKILEISKDFVDNSSIKNIYQVLKEHRKTNPLTLSYAGTTDFVDSSGIPFNKYMNYLAIQSAQANFLDSDFFRIMVGGKPDSKEDVLERLNSFKEILSPAKILIEIHGGWESSINNIKKILNNTDYNFVIDFQNILNSGLSLNKVRELIPENRIAYYHSRNLNKDYIESKETLLQEKNCKPEKVLWEPKSIKKASILEIIK